MSALATLIQDVKRIRSTLRLLRRGLVRFGDVKTVDPTACVVTVEYADLDADGAPVSSDTVPWFQRSSEHRPPLVGDHAIVIDPSLGHGAAVAITGWASTAKPAPASGGNKHVIVSAFNTVVQVASDGKVTITVGGQPMLAITSSMVEVAGASGQPPAIANLVDANFTSLIAALQTAFTTVGAGMAANGPAGATSIASYVASNMAATKVKVT